MWQSFSAIGRGPRKMRGVHVAKKKITRKLCYRKVDRAMRPIYGALKIFGTPWLRPRLLFRTIFHGLLFWSTLWMFLQNLKSVALPVLEIIGGTLKICAVPGYAHAPFSLKYLIGFYSDWPYKCTRRIWSPWLYVPEIIGVPQKFAHSLDTPMLHFLPNF